MSELDLIRKEINAIDEEMASLFEKRMEAIKKIANFKKKNGISVRDPQREAEMIEKNKLYISDYNILPYYIDFLKENINLSCKFQLKMMEGMKVAYCKDQKSASYFAAKKIFPNAGLLEYDTFDDAYKSTESGESDSVLIPIENSKYGFNDLIIDNLFFGSLSINQISDIKAGQDDEITRFAVLSQSKNIPYTIIKREDENFIITFTVENVSGALAQVLNIFSIHGYNIKTLRNRPNNSLIWKNIFFIEAEGNINTQNGKDMLQELSGICADLKLVGSYYSNNFVEGF